MLDKLTIKNYALIDHLEVKFQKGFNVITGETGSGKSLLLGGLGLILGQQADFSKLRDKNSKCIIEAVFNLEHIDLNSFFSQHDLDFEKESLVRRELSPSGKSRAFINDTPVNLSTLKEFSSKLLDIHSQNEQSKLSSKTFLYQVIDGFSEHESKVLEFKYELNKLKELEKELVNLKAQEEQLKADRDFYAFQLNELNELDLSGINENDIHQELNMLSNAEQLKTEINTALEHLSAEQFGALSQLNSAKEKLHKLNLEDEKISAILEGLMSVQSQLDDLAFDLSRKCDSIQPDQGRLQELSELQNKLNLLLLKHRSKSLDDLQEKKERFEALLSKADNFESEINSLEKSISQQHLTTDNIAKALTKQRTSSSSELSSFISSRLTDLGMTHAQLKVQVSKADEFNEYGKNLVQFLVKTNKGSEFSEMNKVASGGELSRIMFLIKAAMASKKEIASLILDEIDTGISGEVASKLATQIRQMGAHSQLIVVSHSAQIASKANAHFRIYKSIENSKTVTHLDYLESNKKRVNEIASILSGAEVTDAALENAKSLLLEY